MPSWHRLWQTGPPYRCESPLLHALEQRGCVPSPSLSPAHVPQGLVKHGIPLALFSQDGVSGPLSVPNESLRAHPCGRLV